MDPFWDFLYAALVTIIGFAWAVLMWLSTTWLGWIFIALALVFVFRLKRKLPDPLRKKVDAYTTAAVWRTTRPIRWPIGLWLTSDYDRGKVAQPPKVIVKEVPTPVRRTFGEWLMSGVRWGIFWGMIALLLAYILIGIDML